MELRFRRSQVQFRTVSSLERALGQSVRALNGFQGLPSKRVLFLIGSLRKILRGNFSDEREFCATLRLLGREVTFQCLIFQALNSSKQIKFVRGDADAYPVLTAYKGLPETG